MVYLRHSNSNWPAKKNSPKRALLLLKRSFVTPNVLRKYPLLLSLHRGLDGALLGVIISGAIMTGLTLHSQHLWTVNFSHLQLTKDLNHRLQESTAMLERYFLRRASAPTSMVPTKSAHLFYIDRPRDENTFIRDLFEVFNDHMEPLSYPVSNGY